MPGGFVTRQDEEEEEAAEADAPSRAARGRGADHITPEGFRALQQEADRLWSVERPRVTEEVAAAAAQGDRSENAEYIYGKKRLREIDRRLRFLAKRLDAVEVVRTAPERRDRIFFGAWFTIEDEDGAEASYRVVGTDEIDLARRFVSERSPLARAVLGKRVGDDAVVQRPRGPTEVTVTKIWYEP